MNYFTHGMRFIERPYFLVGTAIPDMLSVVDRQVRMRSRRVTPFADGSGSPQAEIAAGVLQHLSDDAWFHSTRAFTSVTADLTRRFRELLPEDDGYRPALLGHIVMELLLDGVLIRRNPALLDAYYAAFAALDATEVERCVNRMALRETGGLALFLPIFVRERFLADYLEPERLLFRLNQVLRRVKLSQLPAAAEAVLRAAWNVVEASAGELLPGFDHPAAASPAALSHQEERS